MEDQVQEVQQDQQTTDAAEVQQQPQSPQDQQQEPKSEPPEWVMRRMAEITAKRREAEAEAARWREIAERAQVAGNQEPQAAAPQNVDELARAYAENLRAQERERERLASIEAAGRKEFGAEFDSAVRNLNAAGVGGPEFLRVVAEIPNAEKVVAWLGKHDNLEEAVRIASLNPIQMGIEMTRLSEKAAKAMTKQVSKAPPPVQHIEGGSSASDQVEPPVGSKEWFAWRQEQVRQRRRR